MPTLKLVLDGLTEAIAADESVAAASFQAHATLVGVTEVNVATGIRRFVTLRGPESQERYAELIDAVNVHCPVLDIVANPVPIEREVKVA